MPTATLPAPRRAAAPLVLVPAPRAEAPFDPVLPVVPEPRRGSHDAVQDPLPLTFTLPSGLPAAPVVERLRVVDDEDGWGPRTTPRADLPDPGPWAQRLAQAVLEAQAGHRPAGQLVRWLREDLAAELRRRSALAARSTGTPTTPGVPGVAAGSGRAPVRVRSVHVSEPADGVAEVSAVATRAGRALAVAMRLEGLNGRWLCTSFDVLEPGSAYAAGLEDQLPAASAG
ncbi:hypothetical protein CLV35_2824 [Motilibacter peucedani]|uniref:Uncharacterized protein n=1 Tax=Motilibacter peucedani TaxID=598650 RepID=A0A420XMS9_9ACTN|nr:Rv3235 family protein [Motilibacter peucedani]RKS72577.1 hypothetical protein CLV35_2824 [Motilibacter peucedani]